jgi:hypothetical protein
MFAETIEVRPRYVHVVCTGAIEVDDFVLALNRGLDTAASTGRKAVVMDALDVDGTLTRAERFVLGDDIAYAQRLHGFVAVIAVVANEPPLEADRFAEKVASERGAVGKSFTALADAERWIEDHLAKSSP